MLPGPGQARAPASADGADCGATAWMREMKSVAQGWHMPWEIMGPARSMTLLHQAHTTVG